MKFIGRERELLKLDSFFKTEEQSFILVYGRRRIGKSELVKQALKQHTQKSIYYECKQVSQTSNVKSLSQIVSEQFHLPPLGFSDIESILKFLFESSTKEKMILVLDEYPYLKETIQGLDSILQSLLDEYREESKLTLILLGSYVDVMKSLMLHSSPLFGRVDWALELEPMDYYESSQFYPHYTPEEKVQIYSVFGGIPYYNRLIRDDKSVQENIIDLIVSPDARLENEISMYLSSEIAKMYNANEVFDALARGYTKYSDLLAQSHVSSGPTLVDVLEKLIGMGIVEKTFPINEEHNKKRISYRIQDPLSLFFYKFIFQYSSQRKMMAPEAFYRKYIEKEFEEQYVPHQFETICKQYLIRENKKGRIQPIIEKIGKYYYDNPKEHTNGEFDVVTQDELGYVFYEVKFRKAPITDAIIEKELLQVQKTGLSCYAYGFFSRAGFSCAKRENVKCITLEELFK